MAPAVDEVHDLYEVRLALELQALRRPSEHGSTHDVTDLRLLCDEWVVLAGRQPEPDPEFVTLDEDFHVRLAAASGNPSLADLLRVVNERIRVVRMHDFLTAERVRRTITQHLEIVGALLDGDLPLAVARFGRHLGESMAVVEERAARALARMASGRGANAGMTRHPHVLRGGLVITLIEAPVRTSDAQALLPGGRDETVADAALMVDALRPGVGPALVDRAGCPRRVGMHGGRRRPALGGRPGGGQRGRPADQPV